MQFMKSKRLFILLIGFILLVALIGYSISDRENISPVEEWVTDIVGWTQNVVHTPVSFVTDIFNNIEDFRNTYEENQLLKEELATYKSLVYENEEIQQENEELRSMIELQDSPRDYTPIPATVISRSPERWLEQVTIDKGQDDGVQANMVVITPEGMVGKVLHTSNHTAKVQLLTGFDQFNRISATISKQDGKDIFGMIEGYDEETDSLLFRIIEESEAMIEKDELVVSSELGGEFPAGLTIGNVKEVVSDQYGLTKIAMIEPAANLYDISNVIVVDRDLQEQEEELEEEAVE